MKENEKARKEDRLASASEIELLVKFSGHFLIVHRNNRTSIVA